MSAPSPRHAPAGGVGAAVVRPGARQGRAVVLRPSLLPLLSTTVLFVISGVFFALDLAATDDLAALLYLACAVALLNGVHAFFTQGRRSGMGLLVLHGAMLFWFYHSGLQTYQEVGDFERRFVAIRADHHHYLQALVMVNAFYLMLMVGYLLRTPERLMRFGERALGRDAWLNRRQLFWLIVGLFLAGFAFYIVVSGGLGGVLAAAKGSRSHKTAWDSNGNYGTGLSSLHFLFQAGLVVAANLAFYALMVRREVGWRPLMAVIFLVATAYVSLESGTRNTLLQCIMPAFLIYLRDVRGKPLARRTLHYAFMGAMATAVIAVSVYQHTARNHADPSAVEVEELEMKVDSDFLSETSAAVAVQERRKGELVYEVPSLLVASGPIPRAVWASKPAPDVYVVYSLYRFGIDVEKRGGNALPSVVGQYYMGWGWFGVFEVGLTMGLVCGLLDRVVARNPGRDLLLMSVGVALSYIFVIFRYISFGFFPPMLVMLLLVVALRRVQRRSERAVQRPRLRPGALAGSTG